MRASGVTGHAWLRGYRAADFTLGNVGAWTPIPWDALTATVLSNGVDHDAVGKPHQIVVRSSGLYVVRASVTFTGKFSLSAVRARVTVEGQMVAQHEGPAVGLGAKYTAPVGGIVGVSDGQVIQVEATTTGIGSVSLEVGDGLTFCELLKL